jgi:hypothetical protein
MTDRINRLVEWGYIYRVPNLYPYFYKLSVLGQNYLLSYFPKLLDVDVIDIGEKEGIKITQKTPKSLEVPFSEKWFSETVEKYLQNLPKDYPKDSILINRGHWINYCFDILQMSKYLTYHCQNERGSLARQTWGTTIPEPFKTNTEIKNWVAYYGDVFFHNVRFFLLFTPKHLIVRFPMIFKADPRETAFEVCKFLFLVKKETENLFSTKTTKFILGSIDPVYIAHAICQHYGILLTPLSVIADQLGYALEDLEGRLRVDASKDVPETETINSRFALDDLIFLFKDLIFQAQHRYGVREAHNDIQDLKEDLHLVRSKFQTQVLIKQDEQILLNRRISLIETHLEQTSMYLSQLSKLTYDSIALTQSEAQGLDERLSQVEEKLDYSRIYKLSQLEVQILSLVKKQPGLTRQQIAQKLQISINSISPTVSKLAKDQKIQNVKIAFKIPGKIFLKEGV